MMAILLLMQVAPAATAADTTVRVTFGGFVDTYYAWDFGEPPTRDRSFAGGALFTTQPARHNEFNVNLVFVEAKVEGDRVRGRVAAQFGTSVVSNYSGEPATGVVSGPSASRYLQEAYAGWRAGRTVWIDGGIFYSHMGMEGWVSRDNLTYTRSLVAEYSPYYQSGVRATWTATPKLVTQLDVVNGWQNISESNAGKGAGVRLDYSPSPNATLSYYNFFSAESGTRLRTFNGVGARVSSGRVTISGEVDAGSQRGAASDGDTAIWYGFAVVAKAQLSSRVAVAGRVERFRDDDQVVVSTGARADGTTNPALRSNGASLGVDVAPAPRLLWRTEIRGFGNHSAVFPDASSTVPARGSGFVVTSLGLRL